MHSAVFDSGIKHVHENNYEAGIIYAYCEECYEGWRRQDYIEKQAANMYTVWREAMNNSRSHMGIVMHTWDETMPEIKQVWYTVTAAAMGMHKF